MRRCLELKKQYNLTLLSCTFLFVLKEAGEKGDPLIFSDKEVAKVLDVSSKSLLRSRKQLLHHKLITYTSKGGRGNKGEYTLNFPLEDNDRELVCILKEGEEQVGATSLAQESKGVATPPPLETPRETPTEIKGIGETSLGEVIENVEGLVIKDNLNSEAGSATDTTPNINTNPQEINMDKNYEVVTPPAKELATMDPDSTMLEEGLTREGFKEVQQMAKKIVSITEKFKNRTAHKLRTQGQNIILDMDKEAKNFIQAGLAHAWTERLGPDMARQFLGDDIKYPKPKSDIDDYINRLNQNCRGDKIMTEAMGEFLMKLRKDEKKAD